MAWPVSTASECGRPGLSGTFAFLFQFLRLGVLPNRNLHPLLLFVRGFRHLLLQFFGFWVIGTRGRLPLPLTRVRRRRSRLWEGLATLIYDFLALRRVQLLDLRDHPGSQVVLEMLEVAISILHALFQYLWLCIRGDGLRVSVALL